MVVFLAGLLTIEEAYQQHGMAGDLPDRGHVCRQPGDGQHRSGRRWSAQQVVTLVTPFGPLGLAAGAYLLTAVLTQIMGGQVTALVTGPIAISAAIHMQTSPQAMAVATAIGCSASFFTPLAHPVNILMIGPGNYRFSDFFRIGWALTIVCFMMLLIGMVLFWQL